MIRREMLSSFRLETALVVLAAWFLSLVAAPPLFSAEPTDSGVMGTVVDSETGQPMPFATVMMTPATPYPDMPEGGVGANTRGDGTYRVFARPGAYTLSISFLGYQKKIVTDVLVKAGAFETLDATLSPSAIALKTVEVSAKKVKDGEAALLQVQRKAAAVSDAIGAEQIKRTTDSNAAEVLARVTGLSVVGRGYVYVRGLGERYSMTQVNGAEIGSPEPNKRVVPLDMFPADLLDNVVVQKTYTPDQPGEFAGGLVNVNTRDFPGREVWGLSFAPGYNGSTTGKNFLTYGGTNHSRDFFGVSGSSRDLPSLVQAWASHRPIVQASPYDPNPRGFSADSLEAMGEAFNRVWSPTRGTARPAINFSGNYGNEIEVLGQPLGFIAGASMSNSRTRSTFTDAEYQGTAGELVPMTSYEGETSVASTLWGAIVNANYRLGDAHTLRVRSLYNRSAEDEVRTYEGDNTDLGQRIRDTRLLYVERGVLASTIGMDHTLKSLANSKVQWRVNYSQSERNEPDRREYVYEGELGNPNSVFRLSGRTDSQGLTRLYGYLNDYERVYDASWTVPFKQWGHLPSSLKVGYLHKNKDRGMNLRRFGFITPNDSEIRSARPEDLLSDDTIGGTAGAPGSFAVDELTRLTDSYEAGQDLDAEYFMFDVPLASSLRLVTGVRWESSRQRSSTRSPFGGLDSSIVASVNSTDAMPSVNLTWSPGANVNVRAAYSRTVSRPDLRELTPFELTDFVSGFAETGNPNLKRARIENVDLRSEYYPGPREIIAVSAFHKHFQDPIEISIAGAPGLQRIPVNGTGGYLYGAEFETRLGLGGIAKSLDALGFGGNLTWVKSRARVSGLGVETSHERPLQGQSPYVTNLGLYYSNGSSRSSAALLYNRFGKRLSGVGYFGLPNIYEMPRNSVDATVSHILGGTRMKFSVENILNDDTRFEQAGHVTYSSRKGTSLSFSLAYGSR